MRTPLGLQCNRRSGVIARLERSPLTTEATAARVVIIGGGIAGASIAYHLALLGWRDLIVLEAEELVSGTTSHAPGLVGQLRSSATLTRMLMYSVSLYKDLSDPANPGFDQVGSLRLASSLERYTQIQQQLEFARSVGLEAEFLSTAETLDLFPLMDTAGVAGALYLPGDGSARAPILARAMIDRARGLGVVFLDRTPVEGIETRKERVHQVRTTTGAIQTEMVVVAAGIWSPLVARTAGIELPLVPMEHQYVVAGPIAELRDRTISNLRDPDRLFYARQEGNNLVIGGYERNPRPFPLGALSTGHERSIQPFDPYRFAPLFQAAAGRIPTMAAPQQILPVNGLESFTYDGGFLLGPSGSVPGLWFACGFCAHGVSGAGGVGKVMAEWIVEGKPSLDVAEMDVRRIESYSGDERDVAQRAGKIYGTYYDIP